MNALEQAAFAMALILAADSRAVAQEDLFARPIVLPVPVDAEVEIQADLAYATDGDEEMHLDLYLPAVHAPDDRAPAVVFIHGGPVPADWSGGAKASGQYTSYGRLLATHGIAAVVPNHRFDAPERLPAAARDITAALGWVREHASEHGIDADRICIWAVSAGGLLLAPLLRSPPEGLRCVVVYYGVMRASVLDAAGLPGTPASFAAVADAAVAVERGRAPLPPVLVARAARDYPLINTSIDRFVAAATAADATVELLQHPEGDHGFDVLNDDERSRDIIRRTLEFLAAAFARDDT